MSTRIEWTHPPGFRGVTWNPVTGCSKISAGCANCYAARMAKRLAGRCGYPKEGPFAVTVHDDKIVAPLRWGNGRRVFCFVCSMGDIFHSDVPTAAVDRTFATMALRGSRMVVRGRSIDVIDLMAIEPDIFCILTKRPRNMRQYLWAENRVYDIQWQADEMGLDGNALDLIDSQGWPLPNVWAGVSVENQRTADERIPLLLDTPAAVRFVSVEPMLGAVDLSAYLSRLSWCIVGAETGPGARPMNLDWARSLRDQCAEAGVPFFFKQAGPKGAPIPDDLMVREWPTQVTRDAHTG